MGRRSCRVNIPRNQFCRVNKRLFSHREEGVGRRIQGSSRASAIRGMPIKSGLENWSKKLVTMVRFRILSWECLCFEAWVRWGKYGLQPSGGG